MSGAPSMRGARGFGIAIVLVVVAEVTARLWNAGLLQDGHLARALKLAAFASACAGYPALFALLGARANRCWRDGGAARYAAWVGLDLALPFLLWTILHGIGGLVVAHAIGAPDGGDGFLASLPTRPTAPLAFLQCAMLSAVSIAALASIGNAGIRVAAQALLLGFSALISMHSASTWWAGLGWGACCFQIGWLVVRAASAHRAHRLRRALAWLLPVCFVAACFAVQRVGSFTPMQVLPLCVPGAAAVVAVAATGGIGSAAFAPIGVRWTAVYLLHVAVAGAVWAALVRLGTLATLPHALAGIVLGIVVPLAVATGLRSRRIRRALGFDDWTAATDASGERAASPTPRSPSRPARADTPATPRPDPRVPSPPP